MERSGAWGAPRAGGAPASSTPRKGLYKQIGFLVTRALRSTQIKYLYTW